MHQAVSQLALAMAVALGCAAESSAVVVELDASAPPRDTGGPLDVPRATPLDVPGIEVVTADAPAPPEDAGPDAPEVSRAMFCEGSGRP